MVTFVYVVDLEKGCKYVGITSNPDIRMQEHINGQGSAWTRLHPPASDKFFKLVEFDEYYMAILEENRLTLELMFRYGIERVRGGIYTKAKLSAGQEDMIACLLRQARCECVNCGVIDHYRMDCESEKLLLCSRCGQDGHRSTKCKTYPALQ